MKFAILVALLPALAGAAEHFVSPSGSARGNGTLPAPWDLQTALSRPVAVLPGDTIWVMAGTYGDGKTLFTSSLVGRPDAPIVVRNYRNERATVNGSILIGCCNREPHPEQGSYVWFWGLEIKNSAKDRTGSDDGNSVLRDGITALGPGVKLINLIIHDTAEGIGLWTEAENGEAYGNIIYHNGYQGTARGHGHGIYAQNNTGHKLIADNIVFNQFDIGLQIYGSENTSYVRNITLDGNVVFNSGMLSTQRHVDNLLLGGGIGGAARIAVTANHLFHDLDSPRGTNSLGLDWGGVNEDIVATGNYFIGGITGVDFYLWNAARFEDNTFYVHNRPFSALLDFLPSKPARIKRRTAARPEDYQWGRNRYYPTQTFTLNNQNVSWLEWRSATGFDRTSTLQSSAPHGVWSFVRPNKYEPGRANIVVYNWDLLGSVKVDVSAAIAKGAAYEIRDAQNFYRGSIATGTYTGEPIVIPMTGLTLDPPNGLVPTMPVHTAPRFGTFVLLPR